MDKNGEISVFDLGWLPRKTLIQVKLDDVANVRLMTKKNLEAYRRRQAYRMIGGVAMVQPFELLIPADGFWCVAVDTEGLAVRRLRADVTVVAEPNR